MYQGLGFFNSAILFFQRLFDGSFFVSPQHDEVQIMVLFLCGLSCSFLGCFLIVKKMTMIANTISHTALFGLFMAFLICGQGTVFVLDPGASVVILAAIICSVISSLLFFWLNKASNLSTDSTLAMILSLLMAFGVVAVSLYNKNTMISVEILFGNLDIVSVNQVFPLLILSTILGAFISLFYWPLLISSFDRETSKVFGISNSLIEFFLIFLTSITVLLCLKVVGFILVMVLLIGPWWIGRILSNNFLRIGALSIGIQFIVAIVSVLLSRAIYSSWDVSVSTGSLAATLIVIAYGSMHLFKKKETHEEDRSAG